MQFGTPAKILETIRAGDETAADKSFNRSLVNIMFNGNQIISDEDAKKNNQQVRSNFGEAARLGAHARRQFESAFLKSAHHFRVKIPLAPKEFQTAWETQITNLINKPLKSSLKFLETYRSKSAAVISHGPGPVMWANADDWCPEYVALYDLRIPSDTHVDMDKMPWFARKVKMTIGELAEKVYSPYADSGWNKPMVAKILNAQKDINTETKSNDWSTQSEEMLEQMNQNGGYWQSDKAPTVEFWYFYYRDHAVNNKTRKDFWNLRIVADKSVDGLDEDVFIYDRKTKPIAEKLAHLLHVQYGDLNMAPPFFYNDVIALGHLLYEPCFWANQIKCRLIQHLFEQMCQLLRITTPAGKAAAQAVVLYDKGIIPEGVEIVPANERHQINMPMVESVQAQLKQLMAEATTEFTQQLDNGTQKEMTATQYMGQLNMVNAMLNNILTIAFIRETFLYQEVARRFCRPASTNEDVQKFQKQCAKFGIPKKWLDIDLWDIEPEIPIGAGNPNMALAAVNALMQNRMAFGPNAQQKILHMFATVVTNNAKLGLELVPLQESPGMSESEMDAVASFPTLMLGLPVAWSEDASIIEQVNTLLGLLDGTIKMAQEGAQNGMGLPAAKDIFGMHTVEQHITQMIQFMAQDPQRQELAKTASQQLGNLSNEIKGIEQQLSQQIKAQQKQQQDQQQIGQQQESDAKTAAIVGQAQAKVETMKQMAAAKMQTHAQSTAVKSQLKQAEHTAAQQRADAAMLAEEQRKNAMTAGEITRREVMAEAEAKNAENQTPPTE
jgi:hypothetical protein